MCLCKCRYKTLMTQYQRKGAVGAILVTPIIFLLLILLGQGISEMLDGPRLPTQVSRFFTVDVRNSLSRGRRREC